MPEAMNDVFDKKAAAGVARGKYLVPVLIAGVEVFCKAR